jgi:hypothetical protein
MSYPQNPNTIIVQNEWYPDGLSEISVWNYYQKYKALLLQQTVGKEIMIFLATDVNKTIVMRNLRGESLRLTPSTFDTLITGRTLSIHSTMNAFEKVGIIDLDIDNFHEAKKAVLEIEGIISKAPFVDETEIRYTGKDSFHIALNYKRRLRVDMAKELIKQFLNEKINKRMYDIGYKRQDNKILLDLGSNKYRGAYITPYSLSTLGLRCISLPRASIMGFSKNMAKITT